LIDLQHLRADRNPELITKRKDFLIVSNMPINILTYQIVRYNLQLATFHKAKSVVATQISSRTQVPPSLERQKPQLQDQAQRRI
jgi:hypothetical protein